MAKIGVQMMTIKDHIESLGVEGIFKKLNELGFRSVEVSQIPMTPENVSQMKEFSKKYDISIDAMSASLESMMPGMEALDKDYEKIVNDCRELDCKFLRIGMLPFNYLAKGLDGIIEFAKNAEIMAQKLQNDGIKLYYHTHHVEFMKFNGEYMMDIIRKNAPSLGLELDIHWMQRGGVNPIEYIKSCQGVVDIIHLKDYRIGEIDTTPLATGDIKTFFENFRNCVQFAEVGEGNLDIKGIIETAKSVGAIHFFIEQDDTYGKDAFESLALSKKNLESLGYGEWF